MSDKGAQAARLRAEGKEWPQIAAELDIRSRDGKVSGDAARKQAARAADAPAPKPKGKRTVDPEKQAQLHEELMKGAKLLTLLINESIRPTEQELDAILNPAERLAIRNLGMPSEMDPNLADVVHLAGGITVYALRVARTTHHGMPPRVVQPPPAARFTAPGSAPTGGPAPGAPAAAHSGTNGHIPGASLTDQLRSMHDRAYSPDAERGAGTPPLADGDAAQTGG